jgi:hypothetical protein
VQGGAGGNGRTEHRLGLALSGGGFRASFFHIGVLARLAEVGLLRRVEVLSTVSGGSIVGTAYYLRVKQLLESTPDAEIDDAAYVAIVEALERDFTAAVKTNVRMRALANPAKNVRMLLSRRYSRSDRIGDLYDRLFYKPIWGDREKRYGGLIDKQIELRELLIQPHGEPAGFDPAPGNADRQAKVPILLLNATTLNTGNNWRFEAVRMGEPESTDERTAALRQAVDKNRRLAQGWFAPAPGEPDVGDEQRDFPLGLAVAASACVPGLFHPLSISCMYGGARVQLVDGGVHDNQGIQGLLDQCASHLIVSDASGQMKDKPKPRTLAPLSLLRSSSIYGDRVRDGQLLDAFARPEPVLLMHLRQGLPDRTVAPGGDFDAPGEEQAGDTTADFGVHEKVQQALSEIRTDLDGFSDLESLSLALDGYRMTTHELARPQSWSRFAELAPGEPPAAADDRWRFGDVAERIGSAGEGYLRHLHAGGQRFFRALWLVRGGGAWLAGLLAVLAVAALALGVWALWGIDLPNPFEGACWPLDVVYGVLLAAGLYLALAPLLAVWAWLSLAATWLTRRSGSVPQSSEPSP